MAQQTKSETTLDKIVSLAKRRGYVFQSSEIYGGLNGCWDYGPLGVELLRNVKDEWWRAMTLRDNFMFLIGVWCLSCPRQNLRLDLDHR